MIFDALLLLSGAVSGTTGALVGQTVTGTNTSVLSTNVIDNGPLSLGGNQVGDTETGTDVVAAIRVTAAAGGGTSVQFQLIQADDAAMTANLQVLGQTDAYPVASLPVGTQVVMPVPRTAPYATKRYLAMRYQLAGAVTAGAYLVGLVTDVQSPHTPFKTGYGIV